MGNKFVFNPLTSKLDLVTDTSSIISTAPLNLYVDTTNGSDDALHGATPVGGAFKTISYALTQIPAISGGNVNIYVAPGTYTENVAAYGKNYSGAYTITFNGSMTDLDSDTPTSFTNSYATQRCSITKTGKTYTNNATAVGTATSTVAGKLVDSNAKFNNFLLNYYLGGTKHTGDIITLTITNTSDDGVVVVDTYAYTTLVTDVSLDAVATALTAVVNAGGKYTATAYGNVINVIGTTLTVQSVTTGVVTGGGATTTCSMNNYPFIYLGGTFTANDVINVIINGVTYSYTVIVGDTDLTNVAVKVKNAINAGLAIGCTSTKTTVFLPTSTPALLHPTIYNIQSNVTGVCTASTVCINVRPGYHVKNTATGNWTYITNVDSPTQLTVTNIVSTASSNDVSSGNAYTIYDEGQFAGHMLFLPPIITIGGAKHTGDTITVTFNLYGTTYNYAYTVQAGDASLTVVAQNLAAVINGQNGLTATNNGAVVTFGGTAMQPFTPAPTAVVTGAGKTTTATVLAGVRRVIESNTTDTIYFLQYFSGMVAQNNYQVHDWGVKITNAAAGSTFAVLNGQQGIILNDINIEGTSTYSLQLAGKASVTCNGVRISGVGNNYISGQAQLTFNYGMNEALIAGNQQYAYEDSSFNATSSWFRGCVNKAFDTAALKIMGNAFCQLNGQCKISDSLTNGGLATNGGFIRWYSSPAGLNPGNSYRIMNCGGVGAKAYCGGVFETPTSGYIYYYDNVLRDYKVALDGDATTGTSTIVVGSQTSNPLAALQIKGTMLTTGVKVNEGTNVTMGIVTLIGGTATVNTNKVTATSRIFLTTQGGTITNVADHYISARTPGVSFVITSLNILDTSDVAWQIVEPA